MFQDQRRKKRRGKMKEEALGKGKGKKGRGKIGVEGVVKIQAGRKKFP